MKPPSRNRRPPFKEEPSANDKRMTWTERKRARDQEWDANKKSVSYVDTHVMEEAEESDYEMTGKTGDDSETEEEEDSENVQVNNPDSPVLPEKKKKKRQKSLRVLSTSGASFRECLPTAARTIKDIAMPSAPEVKADYPSKTPSALDFFLREASWREASWREASWDTIPGSAKAARTRYVEAWNKLTEEQKASYQAKADDSFHVTCEQREAYVREYTDKMDRPPYKLDIPPTTPAQRQLPLTTLEDNDVLLQTGKTRIMYEGNVRCLHLVSCFVESWKCFRHPRNRAYEYLVYRIITEERKGKFVLQHGDIYVEAKLFGRRNDLSAIMMALKGMFSRLVVQGLKSSILPLVAPPPPSVLMVGAQKSGDQSLFGSIVEPLSFVRGRDLEGTRKRKALYYKSEAGREYRQREKEKCKQQRKQRSEEKLKSTDDSAHGDGTPAGNREPQDDTSTDAAATDAGKSNLFDYDWE